MCAGWSGILFVSGGIGLRRKSVKPLLAVTMGDINGVGPDILAKAFMDGTLYQHGTPIVLGCVDAYNQARIETKTGVQPVHIDSLDEAHSVTNGLPFLRTDVVAPTRSPGELSADAGRAAMQWLDIAIELAKTNQVAGIVTGPINKEGIHLAGYTVRGHTDYIAQATNSPDYRMCLFTEDTRLVHISDHVSLREALNYVTVERIVDSIRIGYEALKRVDDTGRDIAVAGLNPHAGEAGAFGREEIEIIAPAIEQCRSEGIPCSGPYSPDTVFKRALDGEFAMVIAMYHDQGHIPLKLACMDDGVNVTLGIPIVRTSVDHGTAYDIAGKNLASEKSLQVAFRMAAQLSATRGTLDQ